MSATAQGNKNAISRSKRINRIVIATSNNSIDNEIVKFCILNRVDYFIGSETDVLDRYYNTAKKFNASLIIRLTGDCPFSDPNLIDILIDSHYENHADYTSNTVPPDKSTWPDGSDVEVFSFEALEKAHKYAIDASEREHVTFYFWKNKNTKFILNQIINFEDWSKYRFTVDYIEDIEVVSKIMIQLKRNKLFGHVSEIIDILKDNPSIASINSKFHFGIGWK